MARKGGPSRHRSKVKRDLVKIPSLPPRLLYRPLVIKSPLLPVQDHRSFKSVPKDLRPQRKIDASPMFTTSHFVFTSPWSMPRYEKRFHMGAVVCVRRKVRREVIFAVGAGGARGKKRKPYKRNANSEFICRRK